MTDLVSLAAHIAQHGGAPDRLTLNPTDHRSILDWFALCDAREAVVRYLADRLREARRLRRLGVLNAAFQVLP
jgi:hypothetical protein